MSVKKSFLALRPWSFTAALIPSILGIILANKKQNFTGIDILQSFLVIFTVVLVQAAGNLVNTYYDFINGVDKKLKTEDKLQENPMKTYDPTLIENILTIQQVINLLIICYLASLMSFICVLILSKASTVILISLYALGITSSYFYTGGLSLKYKALGDLVIVLTFGPLITEFTFISCCGYASLTPIYISLPLGINSEAILHANNMRDTKSDKDAGIYTLAIFLGSRFSGVFMLTLQFIPYFICFIIASKTQSWIFLLPNFTIGTAFDIYKQVKESQLTSLPEKVAKFHFIFGLFYIIAVYFSD